MARHRRIVGRLLRVLSWNLFHGRDAPPEPGLGSPASRLTGREQRGQHYAQVRVSLRTEFAAVLAAQPWDVALLQEVPPRWLRALCRAAGASGASALTSRNLGAPVRASLSEHRPDLVRSWEGGSNLVLVRPPWRFGRVRRVTLTRRPERRRMVWASVDRPTGGALAVACFHASVSGHGPERDVELAARVAAALAPAGPLVLGGDMNVRPGESPAVFEALRLRHRLTGTTGADSIDHLLARGLEVVEAARELPAAERELVRGDGLRVRLSDHAQVVATFHMR